MRILMNKWVGGAWGFITTSIINALRDKGHVVERYDGQEDQWHRFDPDIYIGCSGHKQPIPLRRRAQVAIHVNPFGPVDLKNINESTDDIEWVKRQNPDAVFGYGTQNDSIFWSYWTQKLGIPWVPMPTAGDKTIFSDLKQDRPYDLIYLGGRWPYKALTIDKFLIPVLDNTKNYKVHGWGEWPEKYGVSGIDDKDVNQFLNSGRVGPCMSEAHTQAYGIDIPERAFKLVLSGVLAIHDPVPTIKSIVPSMIVARDSKDYYDLIIHYIENPDEASEVAGRQLADVLKANTYHHRCAALLKTLGHTTQSEDMVS